MTIIIENSNEKSPKKILDNLRLVYSVEDRELLSTLLSTDSNKLDSLCEVILNDFDIFDDSKLRIGAPKFSTNQFITDGCNICGAVREVNFEEDLFSRDSLICKNCNAKLFPIHYYGESDNLIDMLEGQQIVNKSSVYGGGIRHVYDFNSYNFTKLINKFNKSKINEEIDLLSKKASVNQKSGEIVNEVCESCGNDQCYFSSFQARSADEGMTIIYECTKCGNRRTLNT